MKAQWPVVTCDAEDGDCGVWGVDWYEMTASNWRELMAGWTYDPYKPEQSIYCPDHATLERKPL